MKYIARAHKHTKHRCAFERGGVENYTGQKEHTSQHIQSVNS